MKTYLVTGGAGFIGSNFIKYLFNKYKEREIKVINLDNLTYAGNLENLREIESKEDYKFIKGNICDKNLLESIFIKNDIDYVINFAAESHVDRSIEEPEIFVKTNIVGTQNLIDSAKKHWQIENEFIRGKRFIQVSTDEVYGSLGNEGYFTEETSLSPHSPYSASKASADLIVKAYFDTYKMPINITRCSNNYGPYQFPEKLIPLLINNCLKHNEVPIYGDGRNIRDWLYVEDHCSAIDLVVSKGRLGEVYNIGGNNEKENIYIVEYIIKILSYMIKDMNINDKLIRYVKDRKGHDRRYAIDASKIKVELGWKPRHNFEEGIISTIDWYLKNRNWLQNVTSGQYEKYYSKMYLDKVSR
ncbi:dTDP-glucose 4,6-dehydratase [Clostridium sp. P21]|uniref:dTDP-glucose 4,6-dehydratase n=1 Tax=Clostridium muellerianum TaxID=2716538 RepID=A0A7Y0HN66_9CLOT|nr:dTDP-glucose 4,6-dehydratase [Clostridium muellerianum]NMM61293.1 dTDP-glucose 4,6-dehydratase [Clostridium muellerianum]